MKGELIQRAAVQFGADPEFFLRDQDGRVVGSEVVVPEGGLHQIVDTYPVGHMSRIAKRKLFVRDGVQIEMNPHPASCRQAFSMNLTAAFQILKKHLEKTPNIKVCFDQNVDLGMEELERLSPESRILGCAPSFNYYNEGANVGVDGAVYTKRSAGGHIHIGIMDNYIAVNRKELVPLLDIIVGNTCVLIDRDPGQADRRKVYGRAGEYRLPDHGLEYRTLSNFWMRDYVLMSLVLGLAGFACGVLATRHKIKQQRPKNYSGSGYTNDQWRTIAYPEQNYSDLTPEEQVKALKKADGEAKTPYHKLMRSVDLQKVREAINNNDLALAEETWKIVKEFIRDHTQVNGAGGSTGLDAGTVDNFDFFAKMVQEHGFEYWFKDDPFEHWVNRKTYGAGAEAFFSSTVPARMRLEKKNPTPKKVEAPQVTEVVTLGEVEAPKEKVRKKRVVKKVDKAA